MERGEEMVLWDLIGIERFLPQAAQGVVIETWVLTSSYFAFDSCFPRDFGKIA